MIETIFAFINAKFIEISYIFSLASTSITYLIIHHFSTKSQTKNYYYAMLIGALVIMFLCNLISLKLMVSIIILLIAIYLYFTRNKENISISRVFYIMLLRAINSLFVVSIEYGLWVFISSQATFKRTTKVIFYWLCQSLWLCLSQQTVENS